MNPRMSTSAQGAHGREAEPDDLPGSSHTAAQCKGYLGIVQVGREGHLNTKQLDCTSSCANPYS
jgi:hypothetical protein